MTIPSPEPFPIPDEAVEAAARAMFAAHPRFMCFEEAEPESQAVWRAEALAALRAALPLLGIADELVALADGLDGVWVPDDDDWEEKNAVQNRLRALAAGMRGPL